MGKKVWRIFAEKKPGFDVEAQILLDDLRKFLGLTGLEAVRIIQRYDIEGISEEKYREAKNIIFSEPPVDQVYEEEMEFDSADRIIAMEYLPGQYDQRADSAAQCMQILTQSKRPEIRVAKLIVLRGRVSEEEYQKAKEYCINPLDSREASLEKPETLAMEMDYHPAVSQIEGFVNKTRQELEILREEMGLAMSQADLEFCQAYFRDTEKRNPTITELRVLDTYWSDHCRHTTFLTEIQEVVFEDGPYTGELKAAYDRYLQSRANVYGDRPKAICLMDLATLAMKELKRRGLLADLDESEEINACSIRVKVKRTDQGGALEDWLVMFKNETHNHPTEIEPFGGAATCLGGAIRDPLSGRSYVYHAMRVTGSGDPRTKIVDTLHGKLPQRKITTGAAQGFSSYGNQIGLATGQVAEVYDPDFVAKRMEIGAVVGAAPLENVVRAEPEPGDIVILLGGRTGRDGCGGATGSSKEHTEESLTTCGAEVQKGNPPTERKIQRLFRKPEVSKVIKRCNDFGAGGVAVAVGELAAGLEINLDLVPKKYEGLDGTELAISESQERMAVVVSPANLGGFLQAADEENLEATVVAKVTSAQVSGSRLRMQWRGKYIVDLSREFLNTNGAKQSAEVTVSAPKTEEDYFTKLPAEITQALPDLKEAWLANLSRLNVCSQKGLVERFDSTIGAGTVFMPFGGRHQLTPVDGMVAKIPLPEGDTTTGTVMTYGYDPLIGKWSPFHGAVYAIVHALAKVVALGGDYRKVRLTLQEYFEKLGADRKKWGKPFSALLGAFWVQTVLGIPAIGGKDSMSGTFKDLNVPPTLVAFALGIVDVSKVISPEFKQAKSTVALIPLARDAAENPDYEQLKRNYVAIHELIEKGLVLAASAVSTGGVAATLTKMAFGNMLGLELQALADPEEFFRPQYGSILLELGEGINPAEVLTGLDYLIIGKTISDPVIRLQARAGQETEIPLNEALARWEEPLEKVFPTRVKRENTGAAPETPTDYSRVPADYTKAAAGRLKATETYAGGKPTVFIPVFPGTNCEYDTARTFAAAGAKVETMVFRNLTPAGIEESIQTMTGLIKKAQIIMIPGGFSAGDEPEGSGKFIATVFRNPYVKEAVMDLLKRRDGLMLGICNGFQALVKLGLVPYGEIREVDADSPTLTFNTIGRHVSCMVRTKVASTLSPWFSHLRVGEVHSIAVSHGEGRFVAGRELLQELAKNGQIATQYVDLEGNPSYDIRYNPNGSVEAIEGITSPDGRVLGKMGHSERFGANVYRNIPGEKDQQLFRSGVEYFK